jgi:hypothetical protein
MKRTVLLLALLPTTLLADVVILKSGGRVSGRIVQRSATSVEVDVGAGTVTLGLDRVERIEESRSALDDYHDRAGRLAPSDRDGWLELARWASSQSLSAQAGEAYHRVLTIDPGNAEANQALGNVQVDGRWVSEAESYQARGYVQYQGEWMTPAQRDALESSSRAQTDAALRQTEAEARARDAEAQAAAAEANSDEDEEGIPLGWGTWGPGPRSWPDKPGGSPRPTTTPARSPR